MAVGALAQAILGFVAIVCLGAVLRLTGMVERSAARSLNAVIIYIGLPAFVFRAVHGAPLAWEMLAAVALAWVVFALVIALAVSAARVMRLDRPKTGGFLLVSMLGNTGYLGYPLTGALLGTAAVPVAVFYDVFGTVMQLVLAGFPLSRRFGSKATPPHRFGLLGELATFPALVAAVLALALGSVTVPDAVSDWLGLVANMVAPLIMLSVGISLSARAIGDSRIALTLVVALKLVVAPLVAALLGSVLISDSGTYRTAVLEAGMPSMMLTFAVGERFGLDEEFIAAAIFVTTVASAITVPLGQMLLR